MLFGDAKATVQQLVAEFKENRRWRGWNAEA